MKDKFNSRKMLSRLVLLILAVSAMYAFWPAALTVDVTQVTRGEMSITIEEEAKSQVREPYIIAMPVTGQVLRISAESGDRVSKDKTLLIEVVPAQSVGLNHKEQAQLAALIKAQQAAVQSALARQEQAKSNLGYATKHFNRVQQQFEQQQTSAWDMDQASNQRTSAQAQLNMAEANLEQQQALLAELKVRGRDYQVQGQPRTTIKIYAPIDGTVLQVLQESEAVLSAGSPLMMLGNLTEDLEIKAELLSSDAVKVVKGDKVHIVKWGQDEIIIGEVDRIEPFGFTKYSALGVEEQRVNVFITMQPHQSPARKLGHGYRVEVAIEIWRNENALLVPSGALFRAENRWAVFVVEEGKVKQTWVDVEKNNGQVASVLSGIREGQTLVLYPSSELKDGDAVVTRPTESQRRL